MGRVGEVTPPHLVLPLTLEPSKPRLCQEERYLDLWIRDLPLRCDHLPDLPRYVLPEHFQNSFDDKSNMCSCIPRRVPIFALNGIVCISYFVLYRLAGHRLGKNSC